MRVALLFIDGVGVGVRDPAINPLARGRYLLSQFADGGEPLPGGGARTDLDTTFGVPGRPQSATNQTAIYTGQPAATLLGRHLLGYPNQALRELLLQHSIVKRLVSAGRTATFANSYPPAYLDLLGFPHRPSAAASSRRLPPIPRNRLRRIRPSASTVAFAASGVPFRVLDDAEGGLGLTHDIDGRSARARGLPAPPRSPEEAASIFWKVAEGHHFTLFEHFLADEAGHARDQAAAEDALVTFDRFARAVVERRPADAAVLICSDHGNVEDLSTRSHTLHPVAALSFGVPAERLAQLRTVADVGPLVLRLVEAH